MSPLLRALPLSPCHPSLSRHLLLHTSTPLTTYCVSLCSMDEKIRKLDAELMKHRDAIRRAPPGPAQDSAKRRALTVLKQKRMYEDQRNKLYDQQGTVDGAYNTLQGLQTNVQMVAAMSAANKEIKSTMKQNKELKVDNVYKMMDEMQDLQADFEEIQDALGAYNMPIDVDEDELMNELDALGDEVLAEGQGAEGLPAYLQDLDLPAAPTGQVAGLPAAAPAAPAEDEFGLPAVPQRT